MLLMWDGGEDNLACSVKNESPISSYERRSIGPILDISAGVYCENEIRVALSLQHRPNPDILKILSLEICEISLVGKGM